MKTIIKSVLFIATLCFTFPTTGQSLWYYGKKYTPEYEQEWREGHRISTTAHGEGYVTALGPDGQSLDRYDIVEHRPVAGPFKAGCSFIFYVPAEKRDGHVYLDFYATFSIEDGAPMDWVLEVLDGGQWKEGGKYRCYGPGVGSDHLYTTVSHTFRLDEGSADGYSKVRLRALEGDIRPVRDGYEASAGAMFIPSAYVGTFIKNLGSEPPRDTTKVLCIGNSFTYYWGTPVLLKEIAWNEGHCLDVSVSVKGGRSMSHHMSLPMTQDMIAAGGYDYVILQDQSRAPARVGKDRKEHAEVLVDIAAFADKVRSTSPDCKAIVECTWAYSAKKNGGFDSIEDFYRYGLKGVRKMAKAVGGAEVSPISRAFEVVRKERPDINLYHTDNHHQSKYGSYLKSCVNYLVIFGEPFGESPADCRIEPDIAAYLRDVAESVVLR